jgi:hypothetical protein
MNTLSIAGAAGRIAGTTIRGALWINSQIDWREVGAVVIHGLQVLIVLVLLAGRQMRRLWDQLPAVSERLGRSYASWLHQPQVLPAPPAEMHPLAELAMQLEQLTSRELRQLAGVRRKLPKRELVALLVAA